MLGLGQCFHRATSFPQAVENCTGPATGPLYYCSIFFDLHATTSIHPSSALDRGCICVVRRCSVHDVLYDPKAGQESQRCQVWQPLQNLHLQGGRSTAVVVAGLHQTTIQKQLVMCLSLFLSSPSRLTNCLQERAVGLTHSSHTACHTPRLHPSPSPY